MVDVLAVGAHPDDIEIFMGGTIGVLIKNGLKVAICDLTRGEGGTYGSIETRRKEADTASKILNINDRQTLDMTDGNLADTEENRLKLIQVIRKFKPEIMFSFIEEPTRHPDHQMSGILARKCIFLAGLEKIKTDSPPHRVPYLIRFPELLPGRSPDFVIDISEFWELKKEAINAYSSQVISDGESDENSKTFLRSAKFWNVLEARSVVAGASINVKYGEPFFTAGPVKISGSLTLF